MEVLDCDACYFVQYKPGFLMEDGKAMIDVVCVERDRGWWDRNRDLLYAFWKEYQERQKTHVPSVVMVPTCLIRDDLYT